MIRMFLLLWCATLISAAESNQTSLFPGDLVKIEVFDNPELSVTTRIPGTGSIVFPLIGELPALAGITPEQLSETIRRGLEDGYLRRAQVTVAVLDYGQRQAYVMGSVGRPGAVTLPPGQITSALQAIGGTGGFLEEASRGATMLLREANANERVAVPLPFTGGPADAAFDRPLQPGDVVLVPRADRIYVLGKVGKPGAIDIPGSEPLSVSKAISLAGGFERFAKKGQVQVLRTGAQPLSVDVGSILDGGTENDPQLKPGDTVFVPEARF
jgi:polysaccharide export outer membrane protein